MLRSSIRLPIALLAIATVLALATACNDSDPTGPSARETLTRGSVFENGQRILETRRDSPLHNRWQFTPNPNTNREPPEGPGAPSRVTLQVTTFPEAVVSGESWIDMTFEGRGIELPVSEGRYPVDFVEEGSELAAENLGVFRGELKMGKGINGLELWADAVSGEIVVERLSRDTAPSIRLLMEGRLEIEFRERDPEAGEEPRVVRAEFDFRTSNPQGHY